MHSLSYEHLFYEYTYYVTLSEIGPFKHRVLAALRELMEINSIEAKSKLELLPLRIEYGTNGYGAEYAYKRLSNTGATVEVHSERIPRTSTLKKSTLNDTEQEILMVMPLYRCFCGFYLYPYEVWVSSIEKKEDGWMAKGGGVATHEIKGHCLDPTCAMMYETIIREIPIQCASFPCPVCGVAQDFEYKVQSIEAEKRESFQFIVSIICGKCSKRKTFKKVLKKLLEIVKIEVKSTGITIKNA